MGSDMAVVDGIRPTRRIVLAEVAGFCFGVKRAVEMTLTARKQQAGRLTTLGPLIHNNQVIDRMRAEGVVMATDMADIRSGTVVMSAHGVAPGVQEQAAAQGLRVLDVTCPFVTKVHRSARQLYEQGYQVLLVGDKGHTEVKGVVGAVEALGGGVTVVSSAEEVGSLDLGKKVGVVSQTTQYTETFAAVVGAVCRRVTDVRAINTVCGATDELQEAAIRLARQV